MQCRGQPFKLNEFGFMKTHLFYLFFQGLVETLSQTSAACKPVIRKYGTVTNLIVRAKPQVSWQTLGRISFLQL